jgi:hypothetical protein
LKLKQWARGLGVALGVVNLSWVAMGILRLLVRIAETFGPSRVAPSFFSSANWIAILRISGAFDASTTCPGHHVKQAFGETASELASKST